MTAEAAHQKFVGVRSICKNSFRGQVHLPGSCLSTGPGKSPLESAHDRDKILYKIGRHAEMQTELSESEIEWLDSRSLEQLMLSFREAASAKCASAFRGVCFMKQRAKPWTAQIQRAGKKVHIGCFTCESDAAEAYDKAAIALHGRGARTNFEWTWDGNKQPVCTQQAHQTISGRRERADHPVIAAPICMMQHYGFHGRICRSATKASDNSNKAHMSKSSASSPLTSSQGVAATPLSSGTTYGEPNFSRYHETWLEGEQLQLADEIGNDQRYITPEMAQRILQVFEGSRDSLDSSDDEEEPARKRARQATIDRALELDDILDLCKNIDPTNPDHLARLDYHANQFEENAKHGYFKWDPYGANKLRSYPELDSVAHLFEQHLDCAGAFGNPKAAPLVGEDMSGCDSDAEEKTSKDAAFVPWEMNSPNISLEKDDRLCIVRKYKWPDWLDYTIHQPATPYMPEEAAARIIGIAKADAEARTTPAGGQDDLSEDECNDERPTSLSPKQIKSMQDQLLAIQTRLERDDEKEGGMLLCTEEERIAKKDNADFLALVMGSQLEPDPEPVRLPMSDEPPRITMADLDDAAHLWQAGNDPEAVYVPAFGDKPAYRVARNGIGIVMM
ncbi:hypothetical protein WJX74_000142 [Apatococcus lobatus]|uniref:AP2/ERF domain-containing protein n=1 Tax=Apatococcus lobatus TaxID=904363 RepID=A0AAW1Q491_9CHLO